MTTKTDIKNSLKQIERYGGKLYTFNSNRYTGTGFNGFPDHIIFYKGYEIFIEVKIGKDKISSEQIIFKNKIYAVTGLKLRYNTFIAGAVSMLNLFKYFKDI